jgi:type IV fimbrial biogenesis protein FimT
MLLPIAHAGRAARAGFTLIEMLITVSMLAIVAGMAAPKVSSQITHARVNGAAQVVAGDLETALSLAGRQRRPIRVVVDGSAKELRVVDRASGQLIARRALGSLGEYKLGSVSGAPATIDILPHGVATSSAVITLAATGYSRRVSMTRGGHIRVTP